MTRTVYRFLLQLHPPSFREQFGGEMLWIFDETAAHGLLRLFIDAFVSLARQWFIRQGTWKVAAAGFGGLLYIGLGLSLLALPFPRYAEFVSATVIQNSAALPPAP